jgi:tetratricopeptide (TPR) repeat protein
MKSRSHLAALLLALSAVASAASGCGSGAGADAAPATTASAASVAPVAPVALTDQPLALYRRELVDMAFRCASALPLFPHVKNRSRAQEEVVEACLELGQLRRARDFADGIANWRRGVAHAELAFRLAQAGDAAGARQSLAIARSLADDVAKRVEDGSGAEDALESAQDWHRDRIRARIAKAQLVLGEGDAAKELASGLVDSEIGEVWQARALLADAASFDAELEQLEGVLATGNFDRMRGALDSCVRLYERFYGDGPRRSRLKATITGSTPRLPPTVRIELLGDMAEAALGHEDRDAALRSLDAARELLDGAKWSVESFLPQAARLAALRHRAGQPEEALRAAEAALAQYDAGRDEVVAIYRAGALRPLAEAFHAMGDTKRALDVYRRAVEEGMQNPNSRPRAEDLTTTACSMALHGVEPDASLWARMNGISASLSDPW